MGDPVTLMVLQKKLAAAVVVLRRLGQMGQRLVEVMVETEYLV